GSIDTSFDPGESDSPVLVRVADPTTGRLLSSEGDGVEFRLADGEPDATRGPIDLGTSQPASIDFWVAGDGSIYTANVGAACCDYPGRVRHYDAEGVLDTSFGVGGEIEVWGIHQFALDSSDNPVIVHGDSASTLEVSRLTTDSLLVPACTPASPPTPAD